MITQAESRVVAAGEGTSYPTAGAETRFKVRGEDTGGMFELTETSLQPQYVGPPPHAHGRIDHAFYVLEGEVEYQAGERIIRVSRGGTVFVPHGLAHKFANPAAEPARMLQIDSIGGREAMFKEMAAAFPAGSTLNPKILMEILVRYDTRPA
jgi:mannose-6-phosphate isomerase-like protein (cupin superfamily)